MSAGADEQGAVPRARSVFCKPYHFPRTGGTAGRPRNAHQRKSTCPPWAADEELQRALINEALDDPGGALDLHRRAKRVWNAIEGCYFVGVSCNVAEPLYNCYPEDPPGGKLFHELQRRAERTRDEVLGRAGGRS
jgi:hypothetical protein